MVPVRWRKPLASLIALALLVAAPTAAAQTQPDLGQIQDVARTKAEEGLALYAEGKWADAYDRFRIAEDLFHAPTLVLHMAHCKLELGELLAARALYKRLADETVPADAPPAFTAAVATSRERLELLASRIPSVALALRGTLPPLLRVTIDGKEVPLGPARVEVDPGRHQIQATSATTQPFERSFEIASAAAETIELDLQPVPTRTRVVRDTAPRGSLVPAFIAYGVGAAGIGVGAVTGILVVKEVSRLKNECGGTSCPKELEEDRNAARPLAMASTIGFIAGGVGVAAGTVLLFWRPFGVPKRATAAVTLSPSRIDLTGSF